MSKSRELTSPGVTPTEVLSISEPLVSIGLPTHNGERFIREALDSLLAQDYPNLEVLISDNASTDGTQAICTEYVNKGDRVQYQRHDVDRGAAHNFEHVMRQARGQYFVWAADHDLWHPSFVSRCVAALEADMTAVLAYPQTTLIDMDGRSIEVMDDGIDLSSPSALQRYRTLLWQLTICNMVYGITRTASIQAIPSIPAVLGVDHLVLAHLALQGTIVRIEEPLFFRRQNRPPESAEEQQSRVLRSMAGAGSSPLSRPIESYRKLRDHHLRAVLRSSMTWQNRTIATIATLTAFRTRFGVPSRIAAARALVTRVVPRPDPHRARGDDRSTENASRPLRVGVAPEVDDGAGGVNQYGMTLIEGLVAIRPAMSPVVFTDVRGTRSQMIRALGCRVEPLTPPTRRRAVRRAMSRVLGDEHAEHLIDRLKRLRRPSGGTVGHARNKRSPSAVGRWIRSHGVDVIFYPAPNVLAFESGVPYVMAIHDLQHRLQPEFPEVSAGGEWDYREYLFRNGVARALMVLVDSNVGREDVLTYYGDVIEPDRVKVLPFLPAPYLDPTVTEGSVAENRARHNLPARYLFFAAQFWSHKNHVRVVQAIGRLRLERGLDVSVVMCGSAEGALREAVLGQVLNEAAAVGVADLVSILGYVPDSDMAALYRASAGVILPTFFGPTNIPVLEGWAMGVPVLTSDIRGIREQCGDGAVLVDPRSVESIGEGIASLWLDETLRSRLIVAGRKRLESYGPEEYRRRLVEILDEAEVRLRNGGGSGA